MYQPQIVMSQTNTVLPEPHTPVDEQMAAAGFKRTAIILTFAPCNANYARNCAQRSSSLIPIPLQSVYVGTFNV